MRGLVWTEETLALHKARLAEWAKLATVREHRIKTPEDVEEKVPRAKPLIPIFRRLKNPRSRPEELFAYQLDERGIKGWVREYRIFPDRKYRVDFAHIEKKIVVEIEGGIWKSGRHVRASGFTEDSRKYNRATIEGWRVFRFTPSDVKNCDGVRLVKRAMEIF